MLDALMYMPQFDVKYMNNILIQPLSSYEKKKDAHILSDIHNAIRVSHMMVSGFRELLDDLNYDEKKLRTLQFNLDDNYDAVDKTYASISDVKTKEMIKNLLTDMAKLDMEIGDLILENTHVS